MHMEHTRNSGISIKSILKCPLSVRRIEIRTGIMAIENLKKSNVMGPIPFWVSVRTKNPLDPNIIPARIGSIR